MFVRQFSWPAVRSIPWSSPAAYVPVASIGRGSAGWCSASPNGASRL